MRAGHRAGFRVVVYRGDLDEIADWAAAHPHSETGGDLFGFFTHGGNPAVQLTLGPGPRSRHEEAAFFQDVEYLRTRGARLQEAHGLQHIGDWHSHHRFSLDEPSGGDIATVHRTLETNGFTRFAVCIANVRPASGHGGGDPRRAYNGGVSRQPRRTGTDLLVTVNAYLFRAGDPRFERGRFVVLPGESPIAASARQDGILGPPARRGTAWYVEEVGRAQVLTIAAGWHTGEWGAAFLRELDALLRASFEECRLLMVRGTQLAYEFGAGGVRCRIVFPAGFPGARAEVTVGNRRYRVDVGADTPSRFHAAVLGLLAAPTGPLLAVAGEGDDDGLVGRAGLAP